MQLAFEAVMVWKLAYVLPHSPTPVFVWVVLSSCVQDAPCAPGRPIKKQQHIRLQHGATRKWLHSHQFYSPMSGNQEVGGGSSWDAAAGVHVQSRSVDDPALLAAHGLRSQP